MEGERGEVLDAVGGKTGGEGGLMGEGKEEGKGEGWWEGRVGKDFKRVVEERKGGGLEEGKPWRGEGGGKEEGEERGGGEGGEKEREGRGEEAFVSVFFLFN